MLNETELQSATERFEQKCLQLFGDGLSLAQCFDLLKKIIDLENNGAPRCFSNSEPVIEHNPDYFSYCTSFEHIINRFFMPLFVLLSFSNILTLLIYKLSYFDGSWWVFQKASIIILILAPSIFYVWKRLQILFLYNLAFLKSSILGQLSPTERLKRFSGQHDRSW